MKSYTIAWGHSGQQGREWSTAREASRYAADSWGEVEAASPEDAIEIARTEGLEVRDWYERDGVIHVIGPASEQ